MLNKWKPQNAFEVIYSASETPTISKCVVEYARSNKELGCLTFYGRNDEIISKIEAHVGVYNSQFPIPVSYDGTKVFIQSWEKPGLCCYSVADGSLIWKNRQLNKVNDVLVLDNILLSFIQETGIVLINAETGEIIKWVLRGYDIDFLYRVTDELVVCWYETKSRMYYYDMRNDMLYLSPIDFGIKSRLKELLANDVISKYSRYTLQNVEDLGYMLKIKFFVSKKADSDNDELFVTVSKSDLISNGKLLQ